MSAVHTTNLLFVPSSGISSFSYSSQSWQFDDRIDIHRGARDFLLSATRIVDSAVATIPPRLRDGGDDDDDDVGTRWRRAEAFDMGSRTTITTTITTRIIETCRRNRRCRRGDDSDEAYIARFASPFGRVSCGFS
jgi:hypothetical protein